MAIDHQGATQDQLKDVEELEQQFRNDQSPEVYMPLGRAYLRQGLPLKAIEVCRKGLKSSDSAEGHMLLAQAYFDASAIKRNFLKDASDEVEAVLRKDPESWEAHCLKGEIALENSDPDAKKHLMRSHELNPDHPQPRMLLKSMGVESDAPPSSQGPFYVNVDADFTPRQQDSLVRTLAEIMVFFVVVMSGVFFYAQNAVLRKKVQALLVLGRSQQRIDTYTGLKKAVQIYETLLKEYDTSQPFALIHLAECHYDLWQNHERTKQNHEQFIQYYTRAATVGDALLNRLSSWHALRSLIAYDQSQSQLREGKKKESDDTLKSADDYLKRWLAKIPVSPRVNWVHGLIYEGLRKQRFATANFKRAAELGWNTPKYRQRYGIHYMRYRNFSTAHNQFKKAEEQGAQNPSFVKSKLGDMSNQKNAYCWIDPPLLMGKHAPRGQELGTIDLLIDSFNAAALAEGLPECSFHPALQRNFKATKRYLPASILDALSVLDSGVGMAPAFRMVDEIAKKYEKVKKSGNLSPHLAAWYDFLQAKASWYRNDLKKSREHMDKALKGAPYEPIFQSLHGSLLIKEKKYDEAWSAFDKAFKADPYLVQPYYEGADQYLRAGQKEKAGQVLAALKSNFPDHADYYYLAGRLESLKGEGDKALEMFKKALDGDKAPYFGYHYDASVEVGRYYLTEARKFKALGKERRIKKDKFPEILAAFKANKKSIDAKIKGSYTVAKDRKKEEDAWAKLLKDLEENKSVKTKDLKYFLGRLESVLYEEAGNSFESAMKTRPGAVDARIWTGQIYLDNERYKDSLGHFDVAASGFLRDLDYAGAERAFMLLLKARIGDGKNRKWHEEAAKFFNLKMLIQVRQQVAKLRAKKIRLQAENKLQEASKVKADPRDLKHVLRTIRLIAKVMGTEKKLKKAAEAMSQEAEKIEKGGLIDWKPTPPKK